MQLHQLDAKWDVIQYNSNLKNLMTKVQILKDRRQRITDVNKLTQAVDEVTGEVNTFLGNEGNAKAKCFHGICPLHICSLPLKTPVVWQRGLSLLILLEGKLQNLLFLS